MRAVIARSGGVLELAPGELRPLARSGARLVPLGEGDLIPLPDEASIAHLPGRRALAADAEGQPVTIDGGAMAVAAILPVGHLRCLLPASEPESGAPRLPLYGYTAVAEHRGRLMAAAVATDAFAWWRPAEYRRADLPAAVAAARAALPGNRVVEQLAVCALEHNCYTAQNTFHRRYEGALPAAPACNADCLGCISLQPDPVPTPQPRMGYAPTAEELAELGGYHLGGRHARIVSFGQGCEGEPLTRDGTLAEAVAALRALHPHATIHVNTNGSRPEALRRLIDAGCNSVRISACGRVMAEAGGQVCLNLLTFPGLTDVAEELAQTAAACRAMGVRQVQWRSLNVDHDWLVRVMPEQPRAIGMTRALHWMRRELPGLEHGNFTRPWPPPSPIQFAGDAAAGITIGADA